MAEDRFASVTTAPPSDVDYLTEIAQGNGIAVDTAPQAPAQPQAARKSPKRWDEISQSADYYRLDPEQRKYVRDSYFEKVVVPSVPSTMAPALWEKFKAVSEPTITAEAPGALSTFGKEFVRGGAGIVGNVIQGISTVAAGREKEINDYQLDQATRTLQQLESQSGDKVDSIAMQEAGVDQFNPVASALSTARLGTPPASTKTPQQLLRETIIAQRQALQDQENYIPAEDRDIYKVGLGLRTVVEDAMPVSDAERELNPIASGLGQGLGSVAGIVASAPIMGPLGPVATGVLAGAGSGYEDVKNTQGKTTEDQALDSAFWNGLIGTSEAVPINRFVARASKPLRQLLFNKGTEEVIKRSFTSALKKYGGIVTKQALEEAAQEAFQSISSNLVANNVVGYDPNRDTFEGLSESATAGGGVGGVMGLVEAAVTALASRRGRSRGGQQPTTEAVTEPEALQEAPVQPVVAPQLPEVDLPPAPQGYPQQHQEQPRDPAKSVQIGADLRSLDMTRANQMLDEDGEVDEFTQVLEGEKPVADIVAEGDLRRQGYQPAKQTETGTVLVNPETKEVATVGEVDIAEQKAPITTETPASDAIISQQAARQETETNPTEAQKKSGRYKKGEVDIHGFKVAIETPKGAQRTGKDTDGEQWSVTMPVDYGYIKRTNAADGEGLDVFIGDSPTSGDVYIIDQMDTTTGKYDESKVMMGFDSPEQAQAAYVASFSDGRGVERIGAMDAMPVAEFKEWVKTADLKKPFSGLPAGPSQTMPQAIEDLPAPPYVSTPLPPERPPATIPAPAPPSRVPPPNLTAQQRKYVEGLNQEIQNFQTGYRVFGYEDSAGGSPTVTGVKSESPQWFRDLKATREEVSRVTRKLLQGLPLGRREIVIAETMLAEVSDQREKNIRQYGDAREQRKYAKILAHAESLGVDTSGDIEYVIESMVERIAIISDIPEMLTQAAEVSKDIDAYMKTNYAAGFVSVIKDRGLSFDDMIPFFDEADQATRTSETTSEAERSVAPDGNQRDGSEIQAETQQPVPVREKAERTGQPEAEQTQSVTTERTEAGEQVVVPGAERISDKELAVRRMNERKRSTKPQKDVGSDGGLFDTGARAQVDMFDAPPRSEPAPIPQAPKEPEASNLKTATIQQLYGLRKRAEKMFKDDAAKPESARMTDEEFANLEARARAVEEEIAGRGKQEFPATKAPAAQEDAPGRKIPDRGADAIRPEMFDGDIKMKLTKMNLEELNQMAFHAGITLTPQLRSDKARLYSKLDDMPVAELRSAASDALQAYGPRKGTVGMMLGSGDVVLTVSGRATTPFPQVKTGVRSTPMMLKKVDQWLMDNAIDEAESRGDEFNARMFRANRDKPQQADKDSAEMYLFDSQPDVVPSILKPLSEPKQPAQVRDGLGYNKKDANLVGSAATLQQLVTLAKKNFYSDNIRIEGDAIYNAKGLMRDFAVEQKGGRYRLLMLKEPRTDLQEPVAAQPSSETQAPISMTRMGDFFVIMGEDAYRAAKILDMAVTKDRAGTPMLGIPAHSLERYIGELEAAGIPVQGKAALLESAQKPAQREKPKKGTDGKVRILDVSVTDAYKGESFGVKNLVVDDVIKAQAKVSILRGEVAISYIETAEDSKRKGYAKKLVDDLFREFPDRKITITGTTEDGAAFFEKNYDITDGEVITQKSEAKTPITETTTPSPQTGAYTLDQHDANIKRLQAGDMTADEALSLAKQMIENKDTIVSALEKMTIQQLYRKFGGQGYGQEKKASVVRKSWQTAISEYYMGGSFTWSPFEQTYEQAVVALLESQTDATIKEGIDRMNQRTEQVKERVEGYKDPKTLEDFRTKVRVDGVDSLTNDQLARYDELVAEAKLEIMAKDDEQRRTVQGVKAQENTSTSDIIETKHTQKGTDLFVVKLEERVEKETYNILNSTAKRLGGYYSSYTKGGAVAGFQFPTRDAAEKFKAAAAGEAVVKEVSRTPEDRASKLDTAGDKLIERGTEKMDADRKVNTSRRAAQAASAEADAAAMIARGKLMKNLAERIRAGKAGMLGRVTAQTELDTINSVMRRAKYKSLQKLTNLNYDERRKKEAEPFNNEDARMVEYPYPQFHRDNIQAIAAELDKKAGFKMLARHLLSESKSQKDGMIRITKSDYLAKIKDAAEKFDGLLGWVAEDGIQDYMRLQRLGITNVNLLRNAVRDYSSLIQDAPATNAVKAAERQLVGKKFEGYFPTPKEVAGRMADWLGLKAEHRVLEPSAGKGNLIEAAIDAGADVKNIDAFEVVGDLRSVLELKGYNLAGRDFTEIDPDPVYDRVIMNPPFENGQDIDHVRKAYDLLKPGGRMVAIMGEGAFFRSDKKATDFRQWLEDNDGWAEKLPEGTFKESGTGVNTRMVFVEKPEQFKMQVLPGMEAPPTQRVKIEYKKEYTDKQARVARKLKQIARETFGDGLNLKFADRIYAGGLVNGVYGEAVPKGATNLEGFVVVALNDANLNNEVGTLNHEGIHFLRAMGALDVVWPRLRQMAETKWIDEYDIRKRYSPDGMTGAQYQNLLVEESIAEAFADYRKKTEGFTGPVAGIFQKIATFFSRLKSYLKGEGFETWRSVFDDIGVGKFATSESVPVRARGMAMASRAVSQVPLYSNVAVAVQTIGMKSAPASQWLSTIKNIPGVKQEELEWMGLEEWLAQQDGKVTKQQVQEFIDSNQVLLGEIMLDDQGSKANQDKVAAQIKASYDIVVDSDTTASELRQRGVSEPMIDRWYEAFMQDVEGIKRTKYSKYQLDGGQHYREMLITLPTKRPKAKLLTELPAGYEVIKDDAQPDGYKYAVTPPGQASARPYQGFRAATAQEAKAGALKLLNMARQSEAESQADGNKFTSQHWEQPNVLAHIRMADHTDMAGNKVLLIEEVQSDWHQTGRKKGYRKDNRPTGLKITAGSKEDGYYEIRDRNGLFVTNVQNFQIEDFTPEAALAEAQRRVDDGEVSRLGYEQNSVPDAPFKKTWHELAMKRMLRYAVDNGYDAVAWTPGEQQAERYDLSKQISKVTFHDNASGGATKPNMEGEPVEGMLNAYDMDGKRVVNRFVQVKDIPDYIGKDAADRLFQSQPKAAESAGMGVRQWELSGQALKVGGEGMIGFYDKMLPQFLSKYVKKWGGKVEMRPISQKAAWMTGEEVMKRMGIPEAEQDAYWRNLSQDERNALMEKQRDEGISVHYVQITDDMRPAVLAGQPMFQRPAERKTNQLAQEASARAKGGVNDLKRWTKRNFTKEGLLGNEVFNLKIESDGIQNADTFDAEAMVFDLEKKVAEVYGKPYSKLTEPEKAALRDYLAGAATVPGAGDLESSASARSVPEGIKPHIAHMREYLDRASARMQDAMQDIVRIRISELEGKKAEEAALYFATGGKEGKLPAAITNQINMIQTIEQNKGSYLNRSYQVFDDPKWKEKVEKNADLMNRARAFFRNERPELTASQIDGLILSIVEEASKKGNFVSFMTGSQAGKKDISFLKRRKDIPEIVRELLGEYTDPKTNFLRSTSKMSNYLAGHYFLMGVRDRGYDTFLFKQPEGEFNSRVAPEGSEAVSPIDGLYTHPDFLLGLQDVNGKAVESYPEWLKVAIGVNSAIKYGKTVGSPTTQFRNLESGFFFPIMNGHFRYGKLAKALPAVWADLASHDEKWRSYLSKLIRLGVLHDNPYSSELREAIRDATDAGVIGSSTLAGRKLQKFLSVSAKLYRASDDLWKIVGFENEMKRLMTRKGMTFAQAERIAARRIRDGYPTYSMVPRAIRGLRVFPIVGTFVSFPWEIMRTFKNQFLMMAEDYQTGDMKAVATRAIGMALAAGAADALRELGMMALGMDDEDDRAVRDLGPWWQQNAALLYLGHDENGLLQYVDLSFVDPYAYLKKPIYSLLRGIGDPTENLTQALIEVLSPFLGMDITAQAIGELVFNKKENGAPVYNTQESTFEKTKAIANHFKGLAPGAYSLTERTVKATMDEAGVSSESNPGRVLKLEDELIAWVGVRKTSMNVPQSMVYSGYEFMDNKRLASQILSRAVTKPGDVTEKDLESAYSRFSTARERVYSKMIRQIEAAKRLGFMEQDVWAALTTAGIGKREANFLLYQGTPPPFSLSAEFAEAGGDRSVISTPEKERRPLIAREIERRKDILRRIIDDNRK